MVGDLPRGRGLLIISLMLSTLIYTIDSTIANVALPHIQGTLQASREQIAWVLTSYVVVSAIITPLTGHLAQRVGLRRLLLTCVSVFTLASIGCGLAETLPEMIAFRMIQGACGAGLVPISQSVLLSVYPRERFGAASALFGMGVMVGPIVGPTLGGWLTDTYDWRYVFFINVPIGALALAGILASLPAGRGERPRPFDGMGYGFLALAVGLLQLFVDRGHGLDWFDSGEICLEAFGAALFFYMFVTHSLTTAHPFFDRGLFRDRNFMIGTTLTFMVGLIVLSTMVLMPTYLEQIQGYPVATVGWLLAPRGAGTMLMMFVLGRVMHRFDPRVLGITGLALVSLSLWQMRGFGLDATSQQVALSGFLQGLGIGLTWVPITAMSFVSLTPTTRPEGTALYTLVRNVGSSIGISLVVTLLARDSQTNQARLVEQLSALDSGKWAAAGQVYGDWVAPALASEVQRQATAIAYANDFSMMMLITVAAMPLVLLMRARGPRPAGEEPEAILVGD